MIVALAANIPVYLNHPKMTKSTELFCCLHSRKTISGPPAIDIIDCRGAIQVAPALRGYRVYRGCLERKGSLKVTLSISTEAGTTYGLGGRNRDRTSY